MHRRELLVGASAVLGWAAAARAVRAAPPDVDRLVYRILRNGREIGTYRIDLERDNGILEAAFAVAIDVRFGPFRLYRYRHRSLERWQGERLLALEAHTDDHGQIARLTARAGADGLIVEVNGERRVLPLDAVPVSYWRRSLMRRGRWFDTDSGEVLQGELRQAGREWLRIGEDEVAATRFELQGDLERELWYGDDGLWLKLRFTASDGSTITYRLDPEG